MRSRTVDIDGPVHYLDYEGPGEGPTFVLLHALAAHHGTWVALAPLLAERGRVLVPDMPGFGLSPLRGRRASLSAQCVLLDRFIRAATDRPVVLVGNSMGGATALLHASARPSTVGALVLLAPAMGAGRLYTVDPKMVGLFAATLGPTRALQAATRVMRDLTPERFVREMIRTCTVDPARVPAEVVETSLAIARERLVHMPENVRAFVQGARSVTRFVLRPRRYLGMVRETPARALVLLGAQDTLVPPHLGDPLIGVRPDWRISVLDDVGHMPQIEDPAAVAGTIEGWLANGHRSAG